MKIAFVPIDNRPVCYTLANNIASIDTSIDLCLPPRNILGDLTKGAAADELLSWLKSLSDLDCIVLSLDTIIYGGLIPSRRCTADLEELKLRLRALKPILVGKKVYAFSSIMRISNNNYNEEEKEYWSEYGKKIFEYSFYFDKTGERLNNSIPQSILEDYLATRARNFEINKIYLEWQKEGIFDTLIFSKDDCAEYGLNVAEARELEKLGGYIKTGADEIPLSLLARAIKKDIAVYPKYMEPMYKDRISHYEDVSIEKSVLGQLDLCGFRLAQNEFDADVILIVNNFADKQGEHVMGWHTEPYGGDFIPPNKPYCVADVRFANGADNAFVNQLLEKIDLQNFYGYSGWNTTANSLGSLLAALKVKFRAQEYDDEAFQKLQIVRFLDDWAYQANVRGAINSLINIEDEMKKYEAKLFSVFSCKYDIIHYSYPWNRKFEIEVSVDCDVVNKR